jgi:hypothetical protein
MRKWMAAALRLLASLRLAIVLLVLLAMVLAVATFIEAAKGRDYVRWYVYDAQWFVALLGLLGVSVLAAALIRFPWKIRQIPFLITHAGLLVLLAGSIQTFLGGIEGQLALEEGETGNRITLHDLSRFRIRWNDQKPREDHMPAAFVFGAGPTDWPEGKTLDLGEISGVALKVTRFLAHANPEENWDADPAEKGVPALKFAMTSPEDTGGGEHWLAAGQFGTQAAVGSARIEFCRATADSLVEDFLTPPAGPLPKMGVLSIHYGRGAMRVSVGDYIGKAGSVSNDGATVEIVKYLPNAKPDADGGFVSNGDEPKNPLVELSVHLPGKKEAIRQIAFARYPFMSLDGVHGRNCPVQFWYHHPAVAAESGIEFLAAPNGKLYCRVGIGGKYEPRGAVAPGDSIPTWAESSISIVKHFPHALREVSYQPVRVAAGGSGEAPAAAEVEVTAGGATERLWLAREDAGAMPQRIQTPEGTLLLAFGYEDLPLGFSLRLAKCTRGLNPGGMGDASFASSVELIDPDRGEPLQREISMNEPLVHGKFAFYQSGLLPDGKGSVLTVAYDPGRFLKYLGSLMVCLGSAVMFCARAKVFRRKIVAPAEDNIPISTLGKAA